jgi:predicted phage baseplate assembly protein
VPIKSPELDDLKFEVVAQQLRRQIPLFTPEWTDHNDSDPGVTMLQLFAHLAEQIGFRLNRLPDKAYVEMLKLVGVKLRPASPALTLLSFYLSKPETALAFSIGEGTRIKAKAKVNPPPSFETLVPVDAVPAQVAALVTTQSDDLRDIAFGTGAITDDDDRASYVAARFSLGWDGRLPKLKDWPEMPVKLFARPSEATHVNLWIGLAFNPLPSAGFLGQRVTLNVQLDDDEQPSGSDMADCSLDLDVLADAMAIPLELVYYRPAQGAETKGTWQPLRVIADTTYGFTRSGAIRFDVPLTLGPTPDGEWLDVRSPAPKTTAELCAEAAGTPKKLPEPIGHPLVGALKTPVSGTPSKVPVSGFLGIRFAQPVKPAVVLRALTFNAAQAIGATTVKNELVGSGTGRSDQVARLAHPNVLGDTLELSVQDIGDGQFYSWKARDDFDGASSDERAYVLDAEPGLVYFGDGIRGRVPGLGARIVALRYRYCETVDKPLPVGTVTQGENLPAFVQDVTNVVPARGGRAAETLDDAKRRAPRELKTLGRAVTVDDFELLATQTPEANIARAVVIPLRRPYTAEGIDRPGVDIERVAPGALSVVAVPVGDGLFLAPTEGMLRAVCRHLNKFRLVTTELYVVAPQYVRVFELVITVVPKPGFGRTQLREAIARRLEAYLHVLHGGVDGQGLGFGGTLHHAELVSQVFRVEGVERVEALSARYDGTAPHATPPMVWRDERREPRNLVGCPSSELDDERIVLFPDETVFVDTESLNVIVQAP